MKIFGYRTARLTNAAVNLLGFDPSHNEIYAKFHHSEPEIRAMLTSMSEQDGIQRFYVSSMTRLDTKSNTVHKIEMKSAHIYREDELTDFVA